MGTTRWHSHRSLGDVDEMHTVQPLSPKQRLRPILEEPSSQPIYHEMLIKTGSLDLIRKCVHLLVLILHRTFEAPMVLCRNWCMRGQLRAAVENRLTGNDIARAISRTVRTRWVNSMHKMSLEAAEFARNSEGDTLRTRVSAFPSIGWASKNCCEDRLKCAQNQ